MKTTFLSILSIFFSIPLFAQIGSGPLDNCGWQYLHNQAGLRYARIFINCEPPAAGKQSEDENTIATLEIDINEVYPSPTDGAFTIAFSQALENETVKIVSMEGKTLYQQTHSGTKVDIDISGFASGTYIVTLQRKTGMISEKVVKK